MGAMIGADCYSFVTTGSAGSRQADIMRHARNLRSRRLSWNPPGINAVNSTQSIRGAGFMLRILKVLMALSASLLLSAPGVHAQTAKPAASAATAKATFAGGCFWC